MDRRKVLKGLGAGMASIPFIQARPISTNIADYQHQLASVDTKDEKFWKEFYDTPKDFVNLENGYYGVQPIPVLEAYLKNIKQLNVDSSKYLRTSYGNDIRQIVSDLARFSGIEPEEALITRNATEALNIAIQGYDFKEGDEVILHAQDYFSMIETFEMLEKQKGIKVVRIQIPLIPENDDEIISRYSEAVTSRTRCILVTHMIHLTGQIMPVRKIADTFRPRGIDLIVDAAHSFAQIEFGIKDLGADFVGVNLHKWFGNPLGAGLLYVKKDRLKDLKPLYGDVGKDENNILKLGHFGTLSAPTLLTIPKAQEFNETVTIPVKEKRLRYLQNYWTSQAKDLPNVVMTTPQDPNRSCAIASFRIEGMETKKVIERLNDEFKIFTVIRYLEDQEVVRITPSLYNLTEELDILLEGISTIASTN